ncbi:Rieske (2Fe-2S) protein [Spongiactinospora sp. TRM90649]|uniref:Rieske (2Fe-2S) protein n=1 Tax=Spongiactinospora sp. TRM90649 TaxID=3031114 RepID=UPI0023F958AB|nr:Rieske (2Fe-2S) protein [Spongiactinospora sp. TRM90649]MDF5754892.1 Rieske (2Fe-2S) protein [Spongiactinospora sp. TRM90649]
MEETVQKGARYQRGMLPKVDLTGRLERSTALDRPIRALSRAIREKLGKGVLRDLLHGVPTGAPAHPPMATVTLGCWVATAVLDATGADPRAARTVLATGLAGAAPAAAAGITDWSVLHIEQQRVGFAHALANIGAVTLYSGSLALRLAGRERAGRLLAYAGLGAASLGGVLGGHLAYRQAAGANHAEQVTHLVPLGWHNLCELKDLPEGRPVARRLGYIDLFVLRTGENVTILADHCSHLAGPLHQGRLVSEDGTTCVVCPWHGSTFRLSDGKVVHGPATAPQPAFQTRIRRDGVIQVRPAQHG